MVEDESFRRRHLLDAGTGGPKDQALAETVVMINNLIAQAYEGKGIDDFEDVLTRWGQLAFAAEGKFATLAGELGSDLRTTDAYQYASLCRILLSYCTTFTACESDWRVPPSVAQATELLHANMTQSKASMLCGAKNINSAAFVQRLDNRR